jgi:PAS domain S-box-containing protein
MNASSLGLEMLASMPNIAYATDRRGRVILANPSFVALTGLSVEEVQGRLLEEVLPLHMVSQAIEHEQQVSAVGMPVSRQIRVDGPTAAERTWLVTKFPLRHGGEIGGIGTVVADVTDQVRESYAAHREASFIREVLERVPNLIYAKDRHRRFTLANLAMAELLGSTPDDVLGRTELELGVTAEEVARSEHEDSVVLDGGAEVLTPEEPRRDSQGGERWFRTTRQPLAATDAAAEQLLVVATDITEYRNAQRAQLRLKDERMDAVGRLAGGIAHDLNNLLTVLQSGAGVLKEMLGPDAELSFVVDDIARASARAASLTQHLLAYSRRQLLRPERIDINQVVVASADDMRRILGQGVELRLSLEPGLPSVLVDHASVGQILINLASNARDAMPGGGTLRVETRRTTAHLPEIGDSEVVEIAVEDSGHGMPPEVLDRVFEPFFTTKPQGKGTGLGLSMVYGIVRQSEGDVVVTSEEGRGTRFAVWLPVAREA